MLLCCAKTAERINVLFGVETPGEPRNIVLDESSYHPTVRERWFDMAFD